jgi:hypothetical protein
MQRSVLVCTVQCNAVQCSAVLYCAVLCCVCCVGVVLSTSHHTAIEDYFLRCYMLFAIECAAVTHAIPL